MLLQRDGLIRELVEAYRSDPSSAIHGATAWLLRKWGFGEEVTKVDHAPVPYDDTGKRQWYVLEVSYRPAGLIQDCSRTCWVACGTPIKKIYFTFVVFPPGEYWIGSPEDEAVRQADESPPSGQTHATLGGEHARSNVGAVGGV